MGLSRTRVSGHKTEERGSKKVSRQVECAVFLLRVRGRRRKKRERPTEVTKAREREGGRGCWKNRVRRKLVQGLSPPPSSSLLQHPREGVVQEGRRVDVSEAACVL